MLVSGETEGREGGGGGGGWGIREVLPLLVLREQATAKRNGGRWRRFKNESHMRRLQSASGLSGLAYARVGSERERERENFPQSEPHISWESKLEESSTFCNPFVFFVFF